MKRAHEFGNNFGLVGKNIRRYLATTALTATGLIAIASPAAADNWTDHTATEGSISVDVTVPNTTNITQNTDFAKVQGDGDINAGWTVNVAQPSSSSKYVLYDIENDPTEIMGTLNANGQIFIFDQNGVIFGENSQVNVGSIVASSGTVEAKDIKDGNLKFTNVGQGGNIALKGSITVGEAGLAAFVAPGIQNSGVINAKMGNVVMASGEKVTIDLYGDNLVNVAVDGNLGNALIENKGTINANGGNVVLTAAAAKEAVDNVINMEGVVDVSSVSTKGGKIILSGGSKGTVKVSGKLDASGKTGGGKIDVRGENVVATSTSSFLADAYVEGNGGRIDIIALDHADFGGSLFARGGSVSGNGGSAEISGYGTLGFDGYTDMSATNGEIGNLLLDPTFVIIYSGLIDKPFGLNYVLSAQALANSMRNTSIAVQADQFIDVGLRFGPYNTGNNVVDAVLNALVGAGNIDLSTAFNFGSCFFGCTTNGSITFDTATLNFNKDLKMGNGSVIVDADIVNLNGLLKDKNGNLLGDAKISSNADTVNVFTGKKIQQGIWLADDAGGATVNVAAGTYNESVTVNKSVILKGANAGKTGYDATRGAETIVDPSSPGFLVLGDNVTIDGFTVTGATGVDGEGIWVNGAQNATIKNNIIRDVTQNGIKFSGTRNGTITGNAIDDTGLNGIYVSGLGAYTISENEIGLDSINGIYGNGIHANGIYNGVIKKNKINGTVQDEPTGDNASGIYLTGSNNIVVGGPTEADGNIITNADWDGIKVSGGLNNKVLNNNITNSTRVGIWGIGTNDLLVRGNKVYNSNVTAGIGILDGSNVEIDGNLVEDTQGNGIEVRNTLGTILVTGNTVGKSDGSSFIVGNGIAFYNIHGNAKIQRNRIFHTKTVDPDFASGIYVTGSSEILIGGPEKNGFGEFENGNYIRNADWDGIKVNGSTEVTVQANDIQDSTRVGIWGIASSDLKILDNVTNGSLVTAGIGILGGENIEILRNFVFNTIGNGIEVRDAGGSIDVSDNTVGEESGASFIQGNGIAFYNIHDNAKIQRNRIFNTKTVDPDFASGVYLTGSSKILVGGPETDSFGNFVNGNYIRNADWDGVKVNGSHQVTVQGNDIANSTRVGIWSISSNDLKVLDNTVYNSNVTAGIGVMGGSNITIDRNDVSDTPVSGAAAGIYMVDVGGSDNFIRDNDVYDINGDGILVENITRVLIKGNNVDDVDLNGIKVDGFDYAKIKNNTVEFAGENGIDVMYGNEVDVVSNDDEKGAAIYNTGHNGIRVGYVSQVNVSNNTVDLAGWDGIHVHYSGSADIKKNEISRSGDDGIEAHDGAYVDIDENDITQSGYGVIIEDGDDEGETYDGFDEFNGGSDGISVRRIAGDLYYGEGEGEGEGEEVFVSDFFWPISGNIRITRNTINTSGDDGIEVVDADAYLYIAKNTINDSGVGRGGSIDYEDADYFGGDGIHVRNVFQNNYWIPSIAALEVGPEEGSKEYGEGEYNIVIRKNEIDTSADDGIEVLGAGYDDYAGGPILLKTSEKDIYVPPFDYRFFDGSTGRVLIKKNTISNSGYGYGGSFGGEDGRGADGIHVENVYSYGSYIPVGEVGEGIFSGYAIDIIKNDILNSGDDGIEVVDASSVYIDKNTVENSGFIFSGEGEESSKGSLDTGDWPWGADGIHVRNVWNEYGYYEGPKALDVSFPGDGYTPYSVVIRNQNIVKNSADDGIEVLFSGDTLIDTNDVSNSGFGEVREFGGDGINVVTGIGYFDDYGYDDRRVPLFGFSEGIREVNVTVSNNIVDNSNDDGIEVVGSNNVLIDTNQVSNSGDDGINILGFAAFGDVSGSEEEEVIIESVPFGKGFFYWPYFTAKVVGNTVNDSGNDGIESSGFKDLTVTKNTVSDSGANGLYVSGFNNGDSDVSSNTFNRNDIGAQFESGIVDLTGPGNTFNDGRVGLRFSPFAFGGGEGEGDGDIILLSLPTSIYDLLFPYPFMVPSTGFAPLSLVDNDGGPNSPSFPVIPPTNFGGTIGAQTFNRQTQYYVELDNGAFFEPGTPTWLNGLNSTYDGFRPADDLDGVIDQAIYDDLEAKFFHFVDRGDLGLFWFGLRAPDAPDINQSFIFNYFSPFNLDLTGLNVTITGLPFIPGGPGPNLPQALNNLNTFAGGPGTTPEDLNQIETAAGGEQGQEGNTPQDLNQINTQSGNNENCWSNAVNLAGNGQVVNVVYGGSFDDNLNQAATCGTAF